LKDEKRIDIERLKNTIEEMGQIGGKIKGSGITRLALSEEDGQARDLLIKWFKEENLEIKIDPIGNIFGIRKGILDQPPIVAGSHLDTVKNAGIYDGAAGVLSALEVVKRLNDEDIETNIPIAVACFTNEEGARFQPLMMGSRVLVGQLSLKEVLRAQDDDGITVDEALNNIGYKGKDNLQVQAFLELHVEQGPILDRHEIEIGVVEGVQGIAWWRGTLEGEANHAGTTPIEFRKDALLGGAELCFRLRKLAETLGNNSVITMGRLRPEPDVINVIPGSAWFTIDFRQYDERVFDEGKKLVEELVSKVAVENFLDYKISRVADVLPVHFESKMVELIETKAEGLGFSALRMPSGAGHDAQLLSLVCPTGMIFVPSRDGKSHCPDEMTSYEELSKGTNVLLQSILSLAIAS
jgi:N-carbamoyl-L-amino-acid hydrolase